MRPLFEPGPTIMTKENIAPLRQPSVPEVPSADENTMLTLNVPRAIDLNLVATRREHDLLGEAEVPTGQRATPNNTAHFGELAAKAAYGIGKGMEQWHEGR